MSLVSKHWLGIESFEVNGTEYQLSIEEVQAHDRWVEEKEREIIPPIGGLTLFQPNEKCINYEI